MPYLVRSLVAESGQFLSIEAVYQELLAAHDYLALQGQQALQRAYAVTAPQDWGGQIKRVKVHLPVEGKPATVLADAEHNLVEVINQCATLERLLDALAWARVNLAGYAVAVYHPTTSSMSKDIVDNDLILVNAAQERARFEISDVVGEKDTNRKIPKDIASLQLHALPNDKLYLVVSPELGKKLAIKKKAVYRFQPVKQDGTTHILQLIAPN